MRVNAEGTGLLLSHCRSAKAALVMSTVTVYKPHPDPWHPFREDDPIGDAGLPTPQPYSIVKIAEEAVARYCAREFDLPITIARMGSAYGDRGGLPLWHLNAIAEGKPVVARWDPLPYSPIHYDDINAHVEALLGAASVPATIVNWAGDVPVTRAGVVALFRGPPRGGRRPPRRRRSRAHRSDRSVTTPSERRSPGRARWTGVTDSAKWLRITIPTASRQL